jgi:CheY-like chemotaxis protein
MELSEARVLVVDDEPALCEIFAQWMKLAGCRSIRTEPNGEAALAAVSEEQVDVLVTDVRMPLMDGVTLVRTLVERGEGIPTIIFVSGFGDVDHREMYGLGVEAFLTKPLRREELMSAVRRAIAERGVLWSERMEIAPRQALDIVVREGSIRLGRGGFSAPCPGPMTPGRVTFHCKLEEEDRVIAGQGYVRWYSRSEQRVGIEFGYLDAICRERVLEEIAASQPQGFVPGE